MIYRCLCYVFILKVSFHKITSAAGPKEIYMIAVVVFYVIGRFYVKSAEEKLRVIRRLRWSPNLLCCHVYKHGTPLESKPYSFTAPEELRVYRQKRQVEKAPLEPPILKETVKL